MKSTTVTLSEISSHETWNAHYWIIQKEVEKIENKLVEIEAISKKTMSEYGNIKNIDWRLMEDFSFESVKIFLEKNNLLVLESGNESVKYDYCFGNYYIWHDGRIISMVYIKSKPKEDAA